MSLAPSQSPPTTGTDAAPPRLASWLIPPLLLGSAVIGVVLVTQGGSALFGWTVGGLISLGLLWVLVSSLFPAEPDRTCPECGGETLVRMDPNTTHGIRCVACAFEDAEASSFLMAEQEGPLEATILGQRGRALPKTGRLRRSIPRRRPRLVEDGR